MARVSAKKAKTATLEGVPTYELSDADRDAVREFLARSKGRCKLPRLEVEPTETGFNISWDHAEPALGDVLFANALGTDDARLASGIMLQLARAAHRSGELRAADASFAVSVLRAIAPRDPTEALLASQMTAIHLAMMNAAQYLASTNTIPQQDSAGNLVNKLARTFAGQLEALKRYRSTGEQSIRVQHVTVNDGGQAIVGTVQAGGGATGKKEHQPHELGPTQTSGDSDASGPPLLSHVETVRAILPGTSCAGLERVPVPRGPGRSA